MAVTPMDLSLLNKVAEIKSKPVVKVQDMQLNEQYPIERIRSVFSKILNKRVIICELRGFDIYLPARLVDTITDEYIEQMNQKKLAIVFLETTDFGKINLASNLRFINLDEEKPDGEKGKVH